MRIDDFKLECYFGKYEFSAPYLLAQSDCESMSARELLAMEPGAEEEYLNTQISLAAIFTKEKNDSIQQITLH